MNKIKDINEDDNNSQGSNNTLTSNSDNVNDNGKRDKKTRKRPCKAERFSKEREELIEELEKMMGLTEEVRGVLLYDLEHNEKLKEYLKNKIPEIRKLYKCGTWNYFVKQHTKEGVVPSEICLLKSIFKSEKFKLKPSRLVAEKGGEKKQYSAILFYKKYDLAEKIKI